MVKTHVKPSVKNDTYTITIPKRKRIPMSERTPEWYKARAGVKVYKALKSLKALKNIASANYGLSDKELALVVRAMERRVNIVKDAYNNRYNGNKVRVSVPNKPKNFFAIKDES